MKLLKLQTSTDVNWYAFYDVNAKFDIADLYTIFKNPTYSGEWLDKDTSFFIY